VKKKRSIYYTYYYCICLYYILYIYLAITNNLTQRHLRVTLVDTNLEAFADADFANDVDDRHSRSGVLVLLGGSPIIWVSRKQQSNVGSTTEAEYVALALGTQEVLWARQLLTELGFPPSGPTRIHEDNRGCWYLAKTNIVHPRTKHIDIRHHLIRDSINNGETDVVQCGTHEMLADIFTKSLPPATFQKHRVALCLRPLVSRGGVSVGA
jgi:hypothetical protein